MLIGASSVSLYFFNMDISIGLKHPLSEGQSQLHNSRSPLTSSNQTITMNWVKADFFLSDIEIHISIQLKT